MSVNGDDDMDLDEAPSSKESISQAPLIDVTAREREFDQKYPNRPRNRHQTLPYHTLLTDLFDPLRKNQKQPAGQRARKQLGPDQGHAPGSHGARRAIIERYISRWRQQVGQDFFPAMRIIIPDKDRDRAMYGLKEKALAKYLVKIMKIDKNSEDGYGLLNWKVPGKITSSSAGDFAQRCNEVLQKRPFRTEYGDMTIQEVNDRLDDLSAAQKEENQLPIISEFYRRMNATEMTWLIRIILRQMKIGATEKTIMEVFHPDAETLFNVSSSLRRVCWDLHDQNIRLETENRGVTLMQCYQPQLAFYDGNNFPKLIEHLHRYATDDDKDFWIEEKLDGERIQMHVQKDSTVPGGFAFKFFSRKAKDYTYLYGDTLENKESSLTQHLKEAFHENVSSLILDGEMITWDPELDRQAAFGTLKTAALAEMSNPFGGKLRPLYRIFDVLLVNGRLLTQHTLRDRRKALEYAINPVPRRFELHEHTVANTPDEIDARLRFMIETAAEGLVLKNPRASYTLAFRVKDWLKVKPEYMENFGESVDCLIIAGYYGSGKRGGTLSSFLCGLRADKHSMRFLSFFKVGGGLAAGDYATIQHQTEGKWQDYDVKKPPSEYIVLAGPSHAPREKPDRWIKPEDSLVVEVKAESIRTSDEFATNLTLRFPRFKKFRPDRDWTNSLTLDEFRNLKSRVEKQEEEQKEKQKFEAEKSRNKRKVLANRKKALKVVGYGLSSAQEDKIQTDSSALVSTVFHGLTFFVMTESLQPMRKTKPELEALIKRHGGKIVQTSQLTPARPSKTTTKAREDDQAAHPPEPDKVVCIADRRNIKVASREKADDTLLIKAAWIFDCIAQAKSDFQHGLKETPLVFEPERHIFFTPHELQGTFDENVDKYGDAFYRETTSGELEALFKEMNDGARGKPSSTSQRKGTKSVTELAEAAKELMNQHDETTAAETKGWMFSSVKLYFDNADPTSYSPNATVKSTSNGFDLNTNLARNTALFAGAKLASSRNDLEITQIIASHSSSDLRGIRKELADRTRRDRGSKIPRIVTPQWILESWKEGTLLDDERFEAR